MSHLIQTGVFGIRPHQERDVAVGVFPEGEEILVGSLGFDLVSRQRECPGELQVGQGSDGIADDDSAMVEDLLEFDCRLNALTGVKKGLAAHEDRIKGSEEFVRSTELIRNGNLQGINCRAWIALVESDARANHRQVAMLSPRAWAPSTANFSEINSLRALGMPKL